jgi:hypothetical protein
VDAKGIIEWMPAHLDEPKNKKKLEKFLNYKKRKMQALQNKRLKQEKKNKIEK